MLEFQSKLPSDPVRICVFSKAFAELGGKLATHTADIVVAGAGHNSLLTACYLAKAGYQVRSTRGPFPAAARLRKKCCCPAI